MNMNEICERMTDEDLDFQTFVIGCLSHSKPFQDKGTSELLAVLERDWALTQQEILEQADKKRLLEMATEELEQKRTRIKQKIDLFERTINKSGLLTHHSVWVNGIECLRGIHGVRGLEIDQAGFDFDEYRKLKLKELGKLLRGTRRTLEDVWPHDTKLHQFARSVYKLARTKF